MEKLVPTTVIKTAEGKSLLVEDLPENIRKLVDVYDSFREKHVKFRQEYESKVAAERFFEMRLRQSLSEHLSNEPEETKEVNDEGDTNAPD